MDIQLAGPVEDERRVDAMDIRPYPPFRSAVARSWFATAAFGLIVVVDLIEIVHWSRLGRVLDEYLAGTGTQASLFAYDSFTSTLAWLYLAVFVACVVTFLAWLSRAVDNAPALGAGTPPRGPRQAIGWWFVPLANYFMPYQIVSELRRRLGSAVGHEGGRPVVIAWWVSWIAANLIANLPRLASTDTVEGLRMLATTAAIADAMNLAAAVLAVMVIFDIQGREDACAVALEASRRTALVAPTESPV